MVPFQLKKGVRDKGVAGRNERELHDKVSLICPLDKSMIIYQKQTKIWVSGQTELDWLCRQWLRPTLRLVWVSLCHWRCRMRWHHLSSQRWTCCHPRCRPSWTSFALLYGCGPSHSPDSHQQFYTLGNYCSVLSKWEFFIKMRAALLAPILPRVMKEGESK